MIAQLVKTGRTVSVIDVFAVWFMTDHNHIGSGFHEKLRRNAVGSAIGTVQHHTDTGKIAGESFCDVLHIDFFRLLKGFD
ncbi:hypothetical protein SDC9_181073 [bioreactor metagenome]|uniref:Uncharacterized protein n=1 Tax=bioreactor metagenome TaxID=1076179 RepID=A0A645HBW7_9ZZZZ